MDDFSKITIASKHRILWKNNFFITSTILGLLFFASSLIVNSYALNYATIKADNATTDILLDNIPVVNTDIIFSEGALLFTALIILLCIFKPQIIPFIIKSVALFILIRSIFLTMTHLSPFPDHISTDFNILNSVSSGADLFFSGHVGMPFLFALMFWKERYLKYFFLFSTVVACFAVILGHLHYTIDVFSAFFITYGIYHISMRVFKKDYTLFNSSADNFTEA